MFETKYVRKLMSMYILTNPHTLFSDVIKRGIVTNGKTHNHDFKNPPGRSATCNKHVQGVHNVC